MDILTFILGLLAIIALAGTAITIALIWKAAQTKSKSEIISHETKENVPITEVPMTEEQELDLKKLEEELNKEGARMVSMDNVIQSANELMGIQTVEEDNK